MTSQRCSVGGYMKQYALIVHWFEEDGVLIADAPDLKHCSAHGATPEEAVRELTVAMELWIEAVTEAGEPLPEPRFRAPATAAQ
jgi:predicted RNase H-like HicB family nuclease